MNIALIRNGFVENVITATDLAFAQSLGYDAALEVTPANRVAGGWNIGGTVYPDKPLPVELVNQRTLEQQADDALTSLQAAIDAVTTWRTTGAGAGPIQGGTTLTTAQLSQAERQSADNQILIMRVQKTMLRLMRGKMDSVT